MHWAPGHILIWESCGEYSLKMINLSLLPCGEPHTETVKHFLLECLEYRGARSRLYNTLQRDTYSLPFLLSSKHAMKPLMRYIAATHRFDTLLGNNPVNES